KGASSSEKPADGETPKREGSRSGHERTQSSSSSSDRRSGGYSHTNGSGSTGSGKQQTPRLVSTPIVRHFSGQRANAACFGREDHNDDVEDHSYIFEDTIPKHAALALCPLKC